MQILINMWPSINSVGAYLKVRYEGDRGYVQNVHKDTVPSILIASPEGKVRISHDSWSLQSGTQTDP